MAKPMKAKFVVEITATASFSIEFAAYAINKLLESGPLELTGVGLYDRPILKEVVTKSYNRLHPRTLLEPAKYGPRRKLMSKPAK